MSAEESPDQPTKDRSQSLEGAAVLPPGADGGSHVYIHGYLHKKTRDGRWQKRWFETNGCFLTYYKNKKMAKLLAALNLPQVGEIKLLPDDHPDDTEHSGALFAIALNDREYMLRAAKKEDAEMWVTKLNLLKADPSSTGQAGEAGGGNTEAAEAAAAAGGDESGASKVTPKELEQRDADPNAWSKIGRCCPAP